MPFNVTLAEMRPLVRSQAAVQRIRFVEDSDLNPWIVNARTRLYDLYADSGDPHFEKEKDLTTIADGTVNIPLDLYRLRRVDYLVGDQPEELADLDVHEVALEQRSTPVGVGRAVGYRLRASELQLPKSTTGQIYRVTYIPKPDEPRLSDGTYSDSKAMDVVDVTGREWVVLEAAINVLMKQRESTTELAIKASGLRAAIASKATRRTVSRLKRVADTASWQFEDPYLTGGGAGFGGRRWGR